VWTLDDFATYSQTIRAGLAVQMDGGYFYIVVDTDSADGVGEAAKTSYTLYHDTVAGSPGVIMSKKNASRTQWPRTDVCDDIRNGSSRPDSHNQIVSLGSFEQRLCPCGRVGEHGLP